MSRRISNECLFKTALDLKDSISKCRVNGELFIDEFEVNVNYNNVSVRYLIPSTLGISKVFKLELLNSDDIVLFSHNLDEDTNGEDYGIVQDFFVNEHGFEYKPFAEDLANKRYRGFIINGILWTAYNWDYPTETYDQKSMSKHYSYSDALGQCPDGWRVPTIQDFEALIASVDGVDKLLKKDGFNADYYGFVVEGDEIENGNSFCMWSDDGKMLGFKKDGTIVYGGVVSGNVKMPIRYVRNV
jgi:hypothetical protein